MNWSQMPPLAALRAFEAAARLQSFSAAARELNVTPAAVSQQVRGLERDLTTRLVERQGRGVRVLPDGLELAATLSRSFDAIADAVTTMTHRRAVRPLQVTMTPNFATHWFMPRFGSYLAQSPDADIVLNPTGALVSLEDGACDIAIRYGAGNWPGLEAEMLLPAEHVIVGAPLLVGDPPPEDAAALARYRWLEEEGSDEVSRWLATLGVDKTARGAVTAMPGNLILPALLDGYGIAAVTTEFIRPHLDSRALVILRSSEEMGQGYYLVTRPGPQRSAAKDFIRWLKREKKAERMLGLSPTGR
ncbi:LysR family transcriptional regulator [Halovulum sp. GXIMD14793]